MKIVLQLAAFLLLCSVGMAIVKLLLSAVALALLGILIFAWLGASFK